MSRHTASWFAHWSDTWNTRPNGSTQDIIVVLMSEYIPRHWWERFLYNENARRIRDALLGRTNILVAGVPFRRDL